MHALHEVIVATAQTEFVAAFWCWLCLILCLCVCVRPATFLTSTSTQAVLFLQTPISSLQTLSPSLPAGPHPLSWETFLLRQPPRQASIRSPLTRISPLCPSTNQLATPRWTLMDCLQRRSRCTRTSPPAAADRHGLREWYWQSICFDTIARISKPIACEWTVSWPILGRFLTLWTRETLEHLLTVPICERCSLEIGAGGGLVGLAVAKGCVVNPHQPMYITDQLEMLSLMQHNVRLNEVEGRVKPLILNWCVAPLFPASNEPLAPPP